MSDTKDDEIRKIMEVRTGGWIAGDKVYASGWVAGGLVAWWVGWWAGWLVGCWLAGWLAWG